jgi:stage V sporulation protein SpoVS
VQLPGGFSFSFPADAVAVGSLRYTGSLLLRADVFTQSEAQARQIVDSANTNLALVRGISQFVKERGTDKDVKAAFDSIQVEQKENVAVFTATIPQSILKKIWSEARAEGSAPARKP